MTTTHAPKEATMTTTGFPYGTADKLRIHVGRGPHRWCLVASRQGRFVTAPSSWQAARYPLTTRCGFCQQTLTIDLADGGPSTITVGHAADCVQSPDRARQGSAA